MKRTRNSVATSHRGRTATSKTPLAAPKSIKYFRRIEYIYATIFLGFILLSTFLFNNKQNEAQETHDLGTIQSVKMTNPGIGETTVKTDKTLFVVNRRAKLAEGDSIRLVKLISGKYLICTGRKEKCSEIEKKTAISIRSHI